MFLLEKERPYRSIFKHTSHSISLQWELHLRHFCSLADCGQISTHQRKSQPSSTEISSIIPYLMHIPESVSLLVLIIYSFMGKIAIGLWNCTEHKKPNKHNLKNVMKMIIFYLVMQIPNPFYFLPVKCFFRSLFAFIVSNGPFRKPVNSLRETLRARVKSQLLQQNHRVTRNSQ